MKEEKIIKKILVNSLLGIFIGITALMISYASIYLLEGEVLYKAEIAQLENIHTLIFQLIMAGLAYYLFLIFMEIISNLDSNKTISDKFVVEHPRKAMLIMPCFMLIIVLILLLLKSKIFTEKIVIMNLSLFIIVFATSVICLCTKAIIESKVIKKINQKLKEKNI